MPLLSVEFAAFFLCFFALYWLLRASPRLQNHLLLLAGMGWLAYLHWGFALAVVLFSAAVAAVAAGISQARRQKARKGWLVAGVALALANLAFFKYFDFFRPALQQWLQGPVADFLLPLGISYYTFQALAYLVSVYRREDVKLKWRELLLHLSFFPTITSGPIARAGAWQSLEGRHEGMAVQIRTQEPRSIVRPALAAALVLLGIAKKWWLAGILADGWVNPVFENPMQYDTSAVLAAVYGYTVQLFLDFSGYTDLVIGMAMLLGFRLPQNFLMPLRAFNLRDFWDRWHITLSAWIRDHIYIPLGGSRKGFVRTQFNLMAALLLSGIWHGYGWNFLLWGALHGAALVLLNTGDRLLGRREWLASSSRIGKMLGILCTLHFVCFTFVVFRTDSLEEAALVFRALLVNEQGWQAGLGTLAVLGAMTLALLFYGTLARLFQTAVHLLERLPLWLWPLPLAAAMWLLTVLAPSGIPAFIYANF